MVEKNMKKVDEKGQTQTTLRISQRLLKDFKNACTERDVTQKEALQKLVANWVYAENPSVIDSMPTKEYPMESSDSATLIPQEFQKWVSHLLYVLEENNRHAAPSIKNNLEAFVELTRLAGGKHAPPPNSSPEQPSLGELLTESDHAFEGFKDATSEHREKRQRRRKAS